MASILHTYPAYRLLLWLLAGLLACTRHPAEQAHPETRTTPAGHQYVVFHPGPLAVRVVTQRPDADDADYQLSVAAAYTDLQTNQPLDLLVCGGNVRQTTATVGFLDGLLRISGDTLAIARLARGQSPPSAVVAGAASRQGTLLLQELLVFQGKNQRGAGGSLFQRRALAEFAGHRFAVVESVADSLTMQQFGDDLLALGAQNALYLDMGDWDEGWYRAGDKVISLGHRRSQTARQSNWLVFAAN